MVGLIKNYRIFEPKLIKPFTNSFHMKRLLLSFAVILAAVFSANAQCTGDPSFGPDAGVYPLPDSPFYALPDGEVGANYSFTFSAIIDQTPVSLGGFTVILDSVVVQSINAYDVNVGPSSAQPITSLGLSYACSAPNCVFNGSNAAPAAPGCAVITGQPSVAGTYEFIINARVFVRFPGTTSNFPLTISFGNPTPPTGVINPFPTDRYRMVANPTGIMNLAHGMVTIEQNQPNPFSGSTFIKVSADEQTELNFSVRNLMGQVVYNQVVNVTGEQMIEFDGSDLPAGIYIYTFSDENSAVSNKMVIGR
jgi:hypothetical protein